MFQWQTTSPALMKCCESALKCQIPHQVGGTYLGRDHNFQVWQSLKCIDLGKLM